MGRIGAAMPGFCLNRIRPMVRIRSPINVQCKNQPESASTRNRNSESEEEEKKNDHFEESEKMKAAGGCGRKIMVVVDTSPEAKDAIIWALTHTIQSNDLLILLYVTKVSITSDDQESKKPTNPRVSKFLSCMKMMCQQKRPEIKVEVCEARGKEKGPTIVEEAKRQEVALLVLGQKKRFTTTWRLIMMWAAGGQNGNFSKTGGGGVVEYCIQNASCMAIAVRRKSKRVGGYLITTKKQKDFWLLA